MHSLRLALRLFRRDWRAGELTLLAQSLTVAIAIVTAIFLFADRLKAALWLQSSTFLAAERVVEGSTPVAESWWTQTGDIGVERSRTVQFISMVFSEERSQFSSVKAVDDNYPLRGRLKVSLEAFGDAVSVAHGPAPGEVWLESRLIPALDTGIGEMLEVGAASLRVSRAIIHEPDRGGGFDNVGPRVMMHLDDLPETKVIQPGSRATYRYLFAGNGDRLKQLDAFVEAHLTEGEFRYIDAGSGVRGIDRALQRVERFLLLGGLLGVLLAGVAIALTSRRYATRHFDHVALMKSFGATTRDINRLFMLIMAILLLLTTVAGLLAGAGVQFLIVSILKSQIPFELPPPNLRPFLNGAVTGGVCLFSFALPPLLRLRDTSPMRVIQRDFDDAKFGLLLQYGPGVAGLTGLLLWYGRDPLLAGIILGGTGAALLPLGGLISVMIGSGRALGMRAGSAWRLALSGMQRRRQESILQIMAFSLAMMLLLSLMLTRTTLIAEWQEKLPENAPNHFIINVSSDEKSDIKKQMRSHGIKVNTFYPVIRGRVIKINDLDVNRHVQTVGDKTQTAPAASFERNLTWAAKIPAGNQIIAGAWWAEDYSGPPLVSLEEGWATRNGIGVDDHLKFLIQGQELSARVGSIRELDWNTMQPNFFIVLSPRALTAYHPVYMTSFFLPAAQKSFLNDFLRQWPTITVIEVDAIVERVQQIMDQGSSAIELILFLILIASALVLIAGIQSSMEERIRQQAIIRALGASHRLVVKSLIFEFCAMGAFAGLLAITGAEITSWALQTRIFKLDYAPHLWLWIVSPMIGIGLVGSIGFLTTRSLMRVPPGLILRKLD